VLAAGYHTFVHGEGQPAGAAPGKPPAAAAPPRSVGAAGWVRPVDAPVWSGFRTRDRPTHDGVDLGAARGTPIRAASAGTVVTVLCNITPAAHGCDRDGASSMRGCGWYVDIRHPGNVYTRYCHLLRRPVVSVGQTVTTGQILGLVGSSGRSSAPHLHFEVHRGDQSSATAVNPITFMAAKGAPLGR
jgi:murein DD-endopeptidase MepM/ murein hydrolase activator NlpD